MNIKKLIVLAILSNVILYAQSKTLYQLLENWPAGCDTSGKKWVVYNLYKPETHFVTESSVASVTTTLLWMAQVGNFNGGVNPWLPGDTLIAFGSIDTAYIHNPAGYGDNSNHWGFYWLFSDTITPETPEQWLPSDTVRAMPKPIVYQTGVGGIENDTIWIKIPNLMETRRGDQTDYDILGYWLWADSTGLGTPNAFNDPLAMEIAFIPVNGVFGDTTVYWMLESDKFEATQHWMTYFVYKPVVRPDTTSVRSSRSSGYASFYFSQNSDLIDVYHNVIGIEENIDFSYSSMNLEIYPNPFTEKTEIRCTMGHWTKITELTIYDASGKFVKGFSLPTVYSLTPAVVSWDGTDASGKKLPSGIYFIQANSSGTKLTRKVILQR